MKPRLPLALWLIAGAAASPAQETFIVSYSWNEVLAGTLNPPPAPNSTVEPGEAARIRVGIEARINGSNAVGQTFTYTVPQPGGTGTVRGLGSAVYDLVGDNNNPSANGTWGGFNGGLSGPTVNAPFNAGLSPGTPQAGGAAIWGFGGSQFLLPGSSANGINSNVQVFRGVWQPASYAGRSVNFRARASAVVPTGEQNSILFSYGFGTGVGTNGEPTNFDLFSFKYFPTDFAAGITIPIIPAPDSAALFATATVLGRRRGRSS